MFEENVYIILNQCSYKISFYFLLYSWFYYAVSEETPFLLLLLNLRYPLFHKFIVHFYFFLLSTSSQCHADFFPMTQTLNLLLKKKKKLTSFYFRANWSLFIKSSLFFSLTWAIFQHILLCTMELFLLQFLIILFLPDTILS